MSLISFEQALEWVRKSVSAGDELEILALREARGRVLARDVRAESSLPLFDNSEVDGYAVFHAADSIAGSELNVTSHVAAGSSEIATTAVGETTRILTGAFVAPGTHAIVMQEDVELIDGAATHSRIRLRESLEPGEHIRRKGADFSSGELLAQSGSLVTPALIGLLAAGGVREICVFRRPRVSVLTTGDELIAFDADPQGAQIRDSSQPMLEAIASESGCSLVSSVRVTDDRELLRTTLLELSEASDLILVSGGVSVGDHDYLPGVVDAIGRVIFHRVAIRPGKPILFGQIGNCWVFGLPGNPGSSYVCAKLFAGEAMNRLAGLTAVRDAWLPALLAAAHRACGREDFVRVRIDRKEGQLWATPVFEQGSFGLRSVAGADALARLSADQDLEVGAECLVLLLTSSLSGSHSLE